MRKEGGEEEKRGRKGELGEVEELKEKLNLAAQLVGEVEGIVREVEEMGGRLSEMEQVIIFFYFFLYFSASHSLPQLTKKKDCFGPIKATLVRKQRPLAGTRSQKSSKQNLGGIREEMSSSDRENCSRI